MKVTGDLELVKFSKSDWIFLCSFGLASFLQAVVITLEDPVYQNLANGNNASEHLGGHIKGKKMDKLGSVPLIGSEAFDSGPEDVSATFFSVILLYYHLLSFILTPVIGGFVEDIGLKQVYMFGIYVAGLTPILSAILDVLRDDPSFLIYSFLIRGIQAFGAVGMQVALYMMITIIFPAQVASVFAVNQAMSVLGLILGAPLAYFIGSFGGFAYRARTFWTLGGIYIGFALTLKAILPDLPPRDEMPISFKDLLWRYFQFLTILPFLFFAFSLVVTGVGAVFLQRILAIYIQNYDVGVLGGAVIPLLPVLLQLLSPLWGYILDKLRFAEVIALMGACIATLALLFVGPAPFLPFHEGLAVTCTGLVLFGLGQGALIVASYVLMMQESKEHSLPKDSVTMTIVSTVFVGAMSGGGAAGSLTSGYFYVRYGFRTATLVPLALYFILIPIFVVNGIINPAPPTTTEQVTDFVQSSEEATPLIKDD